MTPVTDLTKNQHVILNCSVVGIYETTDSTDIGFMSNDDKAYLCTRTQPNKLQDVDAAKPHAYLLNNTTCQLLIPRDIEMYVGHYQCQVYMYMYELQHSCYFLSKPITVSVNDDKNKESCLIKNKNIMLNKTCALSISGGIMALLLLITVIILIAVIIYIHKQRHPREVEDNNHHADNLRAINHGNDDDLNDGHRDENDRDHDPLLQQGILKH